MEISRSRRAALLISAPLVSVLALAGCGGGGGDEGDGGDSAEPQEFSISYQQTTAGEDNPYELIAQQYMDENPEVSITLNAYPQDSYAQTVRTQLLAGNAADLIQTVPGSGQSQSVVALAEAGVLQPLDDSATAVIPAGNESQFQVDGVTYGLALSFDWVGTLINQTAYEEAGIERPTDFDSLLDACAEARSQGRTLFVVAGTIPGSTGLAALSIAATRVYAEEPDWNQKRANGDVSFADSEGWNATLETIVAMNEAGCYQDGAAGGGQETLGVNLATGLGLSTAAPTYLAGTLHNAAPDSTFLGSDFPPAEESDQAFGYASANYAISLTTSSKNPEAATAFLDWLAEPEQTATFAALQGSLPVSGIDDIDLSDTKYALVADLIRGSHFVGLPNAEWGKPAVYDTLTSGVVGLLTGQQTPEQILTAMDAAWDQ